MRPEVDPRASAGHFRCVRPVDVGLCVRTWNQVPVPDLFSVYALFTRVCTHGSFLWVRNCERVGTREPRACTGPFRCLHPVYVCVRVGTWIHACAGPFRCVRLMYVCVRVPTWIYVPVPAFFGVYALCTCGYASGRVSTCLYGPFRCLRVRTWIHVPALDLFCVYALCTCGYASVSGSTCLYRPFSGCSPGARVDARPDVDLRDCIGPFRCVRPLHV